MLSYLWTSPVQTRLSSCRQVCPSAAQPVASCSYSLPVNRNTGWHCHHALSSRGAATRHPSAVANAKSRRKEDSEQVSKSDVPDEQQPTGEDAGTSLEDAPKKAVRTRKAKVSEAESLEESPEESTDAPVKKTRKPRASKAAAAAAPEPEIEKEEESASASTLPPADLEPELNEQQQQQEQEHEGSSSSTAEYDEQEQEQGQDEGEYEEGAEDEYSLAAYGSPEDGGEVDEEEYEEGEYDVEPTAEDDDSSNVDIYEQFYGGKAYFPRHLLPKTEEERQQMLFQLKREAFLVRQNNSWEVEDLAWESHHYQNREGVNKYANVRRIAGMMSVFEDDDYALGPNQPGNLSSWARAEIVFRNELPEFNSYVKTNMASIVRQTTDEEKQEDADFMEDTLMEPEIEKRVEKTILSDPEQEDMMISMYLEGILPNVSLTSTAEQYADDIFVADDSMLFEDDVLERDRASRKPAATKNSSSSSSPQEDENQDSLDGGDQDDDFAVEGGEQQVAEGDDEREMGQGGEEGGDRPEGENFDTEEQS